jgi:hypothetical protein
MRTDDARARLHNSKQRKNIFAVGAFVVKRARKFAQTQHPCPACPAGQFSLFSSLAWFISGGPAPR